MADSIAHRPQMYLGSLRSNGLYNLINEVLSFILFQYYRSTPFFTIEYEGNRSYCISVKDVPFTCEPLNLLFALENSGALYLHILLAMASEARLSVRDNETVGELRVGKGELLSYNKFAARSETALELQFSFDEAYFKNDIEYYELNKMCVELAVLSRSSSFLLKGKTQPLLSQNFLHFPNGLLHRLDRLCNELHQYSSLIFIDEYFHGNYYQIGLAFQNNTNWDIEKVSYAGYRKTTEGGSLTDGIMAGVVDIRKNYRRTHVCENDDRNSIRWFKARLVMVAHVLAEDGNYSFCGSTRNKLDMPQIQRDVRRLVREKLNAVFEDDPELEYTVCNV